jgi:enamine deaminase RidA (YjgF/YER057c/UK114 family)
LPTTSSSRPSSASATSQAVLEQAAVSFADVVRITYLVTRREDFEPIWPVLQRYLGEVRPACTVIVAQLLDPRMLIEVEVTAFKP